MFTVKEIAILKALVEEEIMDSCNGQVENYEVTSDIVAKYRNSLTGIIRKLAHKNTINTYSSLTLNSNSSILC